MKHMLSVLLLAGWMTGGWTAAGEDCAPGDKPCVTEMDSQPWAPSDSAKVIYGDDDRVDVFAESDPRKLEWAASTCALIYTTRLTQNGDGSYTISAPAAYRRFGLPPCDGEPFGNQPTAAFCSGFMVGEDLIVTAGHCYSTGSLENVRFIFGFCMLDANTPRLTFDANQVYKGVEVVSFIGAGSSDHSVVRVDRPITAPGAKPFPLRRQGVIQPGEFVGVLGHPTGLPMKIAFGNTYVRTSTDPGFFVANLDTYGGNSGSPVVNAVTGYLEGILVRGETDFVNLGTCFESNVVPEEGGRGEDVTKASVFASVVPDVSTFSGSIFLDSDYYNCGATATATVTDLDLAGMGLVAVSFETASGDREALGLLEAGDFPGRFIGSIQLQSGTAVSNSSLLEVSHGDIITVLYQDAEDETGEPVLREKTASVDCTPPLISAVETLFVGTTQAQIRFETDEPASGVVRYGISCGSLNYMATEIPVATSHTITLNGLQPGRQYFYAVEARDRADNSGVDDNGGACRDFQTYSMTNHFTEYFNTQNLVDVQYGQVTFVPIDHPDRYQACFFTPVSGLPLPPAGTLLTPGDDGFSEVIMEPGLTFRFYDTTYDRFFVGSNGYITFGTGDSTYQALPSQHFLLPRISAVMCDLNPEIRGDIRVIRLEDRYCVTYEHVPVFDGTGLYPPENSNTFQVELFFTGVIRITWLEWSSTRAIAGLSTGLGAPVAFTSIKFRTLGDCGSLEYDGEHHSADVDGDWRISPEELLRVVQYYTLNGYSCDAESPDGYKPGEGGRECLPHASDYMEQDWKISLSELLRLIQLHNAAGYRPEPVSEDGFAVIP